MASVALLAYVALNLRLALGAVSPVIGAIERQTGLSAGGAGLLTTTPVVCFGAFAFLTSWLINRFGIDRLIGLTMLAVAAGCALRVVPSLAGLFAGTLVIGAAIAVANVALPGIIKRDFPRNPGPVTGAYTMALSSGAAIAAGTSVPIGELTGFGWRPVLGLWGGGGGGPPYSRSDGGSGGPVAAHVLIRSRGRRRVSAQAPCRVTASHGRSPRSWASRP